MIRWLPLLLMLAGCAAPAIAAMSAAGTLALDLSGALDDGIQGLAGARGMSVTKCPQPAKPAG